MARRHRRVVLALSATIVALAAGSWLAVRAWRAAQPPPYEPGEQNDEITQSYAQPYQKDAPAAPLKNVSAAEPAEDGLIADGKPLPKGAPTPRLVDVTKEAGLSEFRSFQGPRSSQLPEDMGGGVAWGDFDNDGFEDLFVVSAGGALNAPPAQRGPSVLFHNLGNGTFQRVTDFPELRIVGMGATWGDFDNDGWLDLVVTGYDTIQLFHNEHGRLVRDTRFPSPKGFWAGAAWGDYDRDARLDLYVCGYVQYKPQPPGAVSVTKQFGLEVPYTLNPSSYAPERNLLFHNYGGRFTEVAASLGVDNKEGRSLSALWHDFDGDGWPDLYVANDVSENKLYLNRRGRFVDSGKQAWISEYRGSMGLTAGDWDGDGDDDLFISHWIAQQFALYNSLTVDQKRAAATAAAGQEISTDLHFMDVAESAGIGNLSLRYIGWGAEFADLDSDGWLDLAVANGSTFENHDDKGPGGSLALQTMDSFLFWNDRGKFFYNLGPWNRSFATPHVSRGLAVADYDNDGALDIAIVDLDGGVRLLRNRIPQGNWVELRLHGKRIPFADGALVMARAGGRSFRREVYSSSYLSRSMHRLHLGVGSAARLDSLEVQWPDGSRQKFSALDVNSIYDIAEGDPQPHVFRTNSTLPQVTLTRQQIDAFWAKERAGMDAMKRESDPAKAAALFREALAINPAHEDSRYYLANCLEAQGDRAAALAQLDELVRLNPSSHRGWLRRGFLLGLAGKVPSAEDSVQRALALNPEETGAMLLLGELAILRGDTATATTRLELACRTNPRAAGGFFLRAWISAKRGDASTARDLLQKARNALGPDWKPKGAVLEGDVRTKMHADGSLLSASWQSWDGAPDPASAFRGLDRKLTASINAGTYSR